MREVSAPWKSELFSRDPLFSVYLWLVGRGAGDSPAVLFGMTTVVLLGAYLLTCRLLRLPAWAVAGAMVTLVFSGYLAAYTGVAVRQGLAMAALIVAIGLVIRRDKFVLGAVPLLLAASLLHWSAAVFAACFAVVALVRPTLRVVFVGWALCLFLSLTGVAQQVVSRLNLTMVDSYANQDIYEAYGHAGQRIDFVVISAVLALLVYVVTQRWPTAQGFWLSTAFLAYNGVYLVLGYVAFSDRLAVYSLILVPLAAWHALSVVQRFRNIALPVAVILAAAVFLALRSDQWQMLSDWG
jgi:hypothetical protein